MSDRMSSATLNMTSPSALAIRTILPLCGQKPPRTTGSPTGQAQDEETVSTQAHRISGRAREGTRTQRELHTGSKVHVGRKIRRGVARLLRYPTAGLIDWMGGTAAAARQREGQGCIRPDRRTRTHGSQMDRQFEQKPRRRHNQYMQWEVKACMSRV